MVELFGEGGRGGARPARPVRHRTRMARSESQTAEGDHQQGDKRQDDEDEKLKGEAAPADGCSCVWSESLQGVPSVCSS